MGSVKDLYDIYRQKDLVNTTLICLRATSLGNLVRKQCMNTIELYGNELNAGQINIITDALIDYIREHSSEIKEEIIEKVSLDLKQKIVDTKPIIEELLQQTIDIENELNEIEEK